MWLIMIYSAYLNNLCIYTSFLMKRNICISVVLSKSEITDLYLQHVQCVAVRVLE